MPEFKQIPTLLGLCPRLLSWTQRRLLTIHVPSRALLWWTAGAEVSILAACGENGAELQTVVQRAHQLTALGSASLPSASLHWTAGAPAALRQPGARSRGVGPTEDVSSHELRFRRAGSHLPWDSKVFCLKMAFAVAMLCRQRGWEEATSTLPLGITSHICSKTHKFIQLFSHSLFRSLEVKMWASPQPLPHQEKSSHATFQHTDHRPPVLITHAYHTLLQNTWGSRPQLFGNPKKLHSYTKDSHFLFTSKPWIKE